MKDFAEFLFCVFLILTVALLLGGFIGLTVGTANIVFDWVIHGQ